MDVSFENVEIMLLPSWPECKFGNILGLANRFINIHYNRNAALINPIFYVRVRGEQNTVTAYVVDKSAYVVDKIRCPRTW